MAFMSLRGAGDDSCDGSILQRSSVGSVSCNQRNWSPWCGFWRGTPWM